MKFRVTGINEESDYDSVDYDDEQPSNEKDMPKRTMIRLEATKEDWCTLNVSSAEIPNAKVGDLIEVTFGRKNQGNAQ